MALAATDFTGFVKIGGANGKYIFMVKYTGPASYAAPEVLTQTIARAAFQGIGFIDAMIPSPAFNGSGGAVEVQFEPTNTGGNVGNLRFMNATHAHNHDMAIIGGLTSSEPVFLDASVSLGKTAATNRTVLGATSSTTGGVKNAAAAAAATEVTSTTNLSTYSCWFIGIGTA